MRWRGAARTRLRGAQPPGDLFGSLPPDHPLLASDPHRPLEGNLAGLAAFVRPGDAIIDVGGGAGRYKPRRDPSDTYLHSAVAENSGVR